MSYLDFIQFSGLGHLALWSYVDTSDGCCSLDMAHRVTGLVVTYFYSVFSQCIFFKVSFPFSPKSQQLLSKKKVGYSSFNMLTFCDKMPHL